MQMSPRPLAVLALDASEGNGGAIDDLRVSPQDH
jgi:hypothetical protein